MHRDITRERERCVASTHPRQNNPRVRNSALFMVRGCETSGRISSKQDTSAAQHIHDSGQFQQGTDSVRSSEIRLTLTPVNHRGNISHLSLITLLIHFSFSAPLLFCLLCSALVLVWSDYTRMESSLSSLISTLYESDWRQSSHVVSDKISCPLQICSCLTLFGSLIG